MERRIAEWRKSARGGEIQPISQERLHGGSKQGRASVTCSPDSCGIPSLIGVIDPPLLLWYFSGWPKRAFLPIPTAMCSTTTTIELRVPLGGL